MKSLVLAAVVASLSLPVSAMNAYRCGNYLVQKGERTFDVLDVCGQPEGVYRYQQEEWIYNQPIVVNYERWKYSDYGKYPTYITFRNGVVSSFAQGKRR